MVIVLLVFVAIGAVFANRESLFYRHRRRSPSLLSERDGGLGMIEMETVVVGEGGRMNVQIGVVSLEDRIRDVVRQLSVEGHGAFASCPAEKYGGELRELKVGQPQQAARGIISFMRVPDSLVHTGMTGGVKAIVAEITHTGSVDAQACLNYVLLQRAGTWDRIFANSPYPPDCDAEGVRADRLTTGGEGMRLADFVDHPDARVAALSDAHVLALRLYTTLVYKSINTPLRKLAHTPAAGSASARPHPLPVTVAFLSEAIKKLRAVAGASQGDTTASGRDRTSHGDTSNVHESKQGGVDATPALGVDDCTTPALTAANETAGGRGNGGTGAPGPLGSVRSSPHRLLDLWRGLKDVSISGNEAFRRGGPRSRR